MPVNRPSTNSLAKRKLEVSENWQRLGMEITHYGARHFLTLTDWPIAFLNLEAVGKAGRFEQGPPNELFSDNDPAFYSSEFRAFAHEWKINLWFHSAYAPARNGIAEWCHCTVKQTVARMRCSIQEAVYWHNVNPKHGESPQTAPSNRVRRYKVRVKGFDTPMTSSDPKHSFYQIGDHVWVKVPYSRCTTKFNRARVTGMMSPQLLLVDGIPHDVKDLHPHFSFTAPEKDSASTSESDNASESEAQCLLFDRESAESDCPPQEEAEAESPFPPLRRSACQKRPPPSCHLCDQERRRGCNENNDLPRNPKQARTCFVGKARKYS